MSKKGTKKSLSLTLRNYFITGVVVLIPIGFTLYLSKILIGLSSNIIPENINPNNYLPYDIPGLEIIISFTDPLSSNSRIEKSLTFQIFNESSHFIPRASTL